MTIENKSLSHLDSHGHATMVDIADKPVTARQAVAQGFVHLKPETIAAITDGTVPKGEVLGTARIAGIMAAKRCADLIPLCHSLTLESVRIDFEFDQAENKLRITATASITARTGVEMEALTAVSIAALTIYDMCKAIDKSMVIEGIRLVRKTGGRSS